MYQQTSTRRHALHGFDAVDVQLRPELIGHDDFHDGWTAMRPRTVVDRELREQDQILVTRQDHGKLRRLVRESRPYIDATMLELLEAELDRARVVDETHVPGHVVTMNSRVLYEDLDSGEHAQVRLVYRDAVRPGEPHVSVLAPVGAALLGLSVRQSITWPFEGRAPLRLRVSAVLYQPEAAAAGVRRSGPVLS